MIVANTEETIIGPIAVTLKSPMINSLANHAPAKGPLKVADNPAADRRIAHGVKRQQRGAGPRLAQPGGRRTAREEQRRG